MTTAEIDFTPFTGKRVKVTRNLTDGTTEEVEGVVTTGNSLGLLIRLKGKATTELIEADAIEGEPRLVAEPPKQITAKVLAWPTEDKVIAHLLERHGLTLTAANKMTPKEGMELHGQIDHVKEDLGHVHQSDEEKAAAKAAKAAQAPAESTAAAAA